MFFLIPEALSHLQSGTEEYIEEPIRCHTLTLQHEHKCIHLNPGYFNAAPRSCFISGANSNLSCLASPKIRE